MDKLKHNPGVVGQKWKFAGTLLTQDNVAMVRIAGSNMWSVLVPPGVVYSLHLVRSYNNLPIPLLDKHIHLPPSYIEEVGQIHIVHSMLIVV